MAVATEERRLRSLPDGLFSLMMNYWAFAVALAFVMGTNVA